MRESRGTPIDRASRHIYPDVFRILGQGKLRAVSATEFDNRANVPRSNEVVQNLGLELRQPAVGTRSGGTALAVHIFPKRSGAGKCEPTRPCKNRELSELPGSRPNERDVFDKSLQARRMRNFPVHIDS